MDQDCLNSCELPWVLGSASTCCHEESEFDLATQKPKVEFSQQPGSRRSAVGGPVGPSTFAGSAADCVILLERVEARDGSVAGFRRGPRTDLAISFMACSPNCLVENLFLAGLQLPTEPVTASFCQSRRVS